MRIHWLLFVCVCICTLYFTCCWVRVDVCCCSIRRKEPHNKKELRLCNFQPLLHNTHTHINQCMNKCVCMSHVNQTQQIKANWLPAIYIILFLLNSAEATTTAIKRGLRIVRKTSKARMICDIELIFVFDDGHESVFGGEVHWPCGNGKARQPLYAYSIPRRHTTHNDKGNPQIPHEAG